MKKTHLTQNGRPCFMKRYLLPAIILTGAAGLLTAAGFLILHIRAPEGEPPEESASFCYRLGTYDGRIAVFPTGAEEPARVLDIPLSAFPEGDQNLLRSGILLRSEEELRQAIEDFM